MGDNASKACVCFVARPVDPQVDPKACLLDHTSTHDWNKTVLTTLGFPPGVKCPYQKNPQDTESPRLQNITDASHAAAGKKEGHCQQSTVTAHPRWAKQEKMMKSVDYAGSAKQGTGLVCKKMWEYHHLIIFVHDI